VLIGTKRNLVLQSSPDMTRGLGTKSISQYLSSEVFEDSGEVDGGTCTDTLSVFPCFQEPSDAANRELESSLVRPRHGFGGGGSFRLPTASRTHGFFSVSPSLCCNVSEMAELELRGAKKM
jgi:hypothetical protein